MPAHAPFDPAALLAAPGVRDAELEVLFQESPVGIAFVSGPGTPGGPAAGTILRANPTFCGILGYAAAELEGARTVGELTHPDDADADERMAERVAAGQDRSYRIQKRLLTKFAGVVHVDQTVTRVAGRDGVFVHLITHCTPLRVPDGALRVEVDADGNPSLRPYVSLVKLLLDNWKVVAPTLTVAFGTVVAAAQQHLNARAELDALRKTNEAQKATLDELGRELKDVRRTLPPGGLLPRPDR